jgi:hypothetical protein
MDKQAWKGTEKNTNKHLNEIKEDT